MKRFFTIFLLIFLYSLEVVAQEEIQIGTKINFEYTQCKDIKKTLEILNKELKLQEFCAEQSEFYDEKRLLDGVLETVKIHHPTNMLMLGDSREDDYVSVITYVALYDLNDDGFKELFFAHGSTYATMLRLDILEKQNKKFHVIAQGLIEAKADTFVLPNKTNGYHDIFQKSDVWNEKWLYQFIDQKYKLVEHTK